MFRHLMEAAQKEDLKIKCVHETQDGTTDPIVPTLLLMTQSMVTTRITTLSVISLSILTHGSWTTGQRLERHARDNHSSLFRKLRP
jgi:hypothetical protein